MGRGPRLRMLGIPVIALSGCVGEGLAIAGALGTTLGRVGTYVVVLVLVGGTYAVALKIMYPWFLLMAETRRRRAVLIGSLGLAFLSTCILLNNSVRFAANSQKLAKVNATLDALSGEGTAAASVQSLLDDIAQAREDEVRAQISAGQLGRRAGAKVLVQLTAARRKSLQDTLELAIRRAGSAAVGSTAP